VLGGDNARWSKNAASVNTHQVFGTPCRAGPIKYSARRAAPAFIWRQDLATGRLQRAKQLLGRIFAESDEIWTAAIDGRRKRTAHTVSRRSKNDEDDTSQKASGPLMRGAIQTDAG
jgi:hypothetical protein